jgi:hypothetical protein
MKKLRFRWIKEGFQARAQKVIAIYNCNLKPASWSPPCTASPTTLNGEFAGLGGLYYD